MLEYVIIPFVASLFSMLLLFWQDMIRFDELRITSVRERRACRFRGCIGTGHFNSRSREGATSRFEWKMGSVTISIHAPVRERPAGLSTTSF